MAFDAYAEGASDLLRSRAKLREIIDTLGDNLPVELQYIRREKLDASHTLSRLGRDSAAGNKRRDAVEAGPSHSSKSLTQKEVPSAFEAEWARLPAAIAALPSFVKIKQLVSRNSKDRASFQHAMRVLHNGIDHCFMTRPAFGHVLEDLDWDSQTAIDGLIEDAGLLPLPVDPLSLTEALWESNFGVPRNLEWYSALAQSPDGVSSCTSVRFAPLKPNRFGLSRFSMESPTDVVHCAVGGTKRRLQLVGPATGLLCAVVQGSLLLIVWPSTKNNFDICYWLSCSLDTDVYDHLDELEEPRINVLRTGDTVYLPAGTSNIMVALTNVCLTSRQILNPVSKELKDIERCCNHLMDTYIDQQSAGYSPFDEMEVEKMDAILKLWSTVTELLSGPELSNVLNPNERASAHRTQTSLGRPVQTFAHGLREIADKIERYRNLVYEAVKGHQNKEADCSPRNRPFMTLYALANLYLRGTEWCEAVADSHSSKVTREGMYHSLRTNFTPKGKGRVPS